jgi:hypothetical protein
VASVAPFRALMDRLSWRRTRTRVAACGSFSTEANPGIPALCCSSKMITPELYPPLAVFRGLSPSLGPNYHKRGEGTILPTPDALTFLPVIDAQHLQYLVTTGVDLCDGLGQQLHFRVTPNPNIVTVQAGSSSLSGVFVKAEMPINYAGYADISVMRGQK